MSMKSMGNEYNLNLKENKNEMPRPGYEVLDFGCAEWCQYAEQCTGGTPEEIKAKQKAEHGDPL